MRRRTALTTVGTFLTAGLAGCTSSQPGETGTQTPTSVPTESPPPETPSGPFVRYFIYNDDDETHPLDVTIESAEGEVIHSRSDPEFAPGEQFGATTSGYDPAQGPFSITFSLESLADTLEWKVEECPRFDLLVAVSDGQFEFERELCIK